MGSVDEMRARLDCGICGAPKPVGDACRPCANRRNAEYKIRHAAEIAEGRAEYKRRKWLEGAPLRAEKRAEKRRTLKQRRAKAKRAWKLKNPGAVNASTAKRFATKMSAVPAWANDFFLSETYSLARLRSRLTGFEWHVDHEVPLRSALVCGLHTHQNLRVIPAIENMRKGNRLDRSVNL